PLPYTTLFRSRTIDPWLNASSGRMLAIRDRAGDEHFRARAELRLAQAFREGGDFLFDLAQAAFFSARCSTGFTSADRFIAVLTSATWVKACGKLPSWRPERGSYSS